ncbi:MAG: hypothetical protein SOZ59_02540 [Candidatus Limivivens sp.]|nr:hypothetical protein [Candidatus Limivivens sp.]
MDIAVPAGSRFYLQGKVCNSAGMKTQCIWSRYPEADSSDKNIFMRQKEGTAEIRIPEAAHSGETYHFLCTAIKGTEIPIKTYTRVVVTIL